jgi:hypothetical protein
MKSGKFVIVEIYYEQTLFFEINLSRKPKKREKQPYYLI